MSKSAEDVELGKGKINQVLDKLEKYISGHGGPYALGADVTYVDFLLGEHLDQARILFADCITAHPALSAYLDRFLAIPKVASFKQAPSYLESPVNNIMAYCNN
mmetsp:Transcript_14133/g.33377  ORF Transcript_14133/g.33377 Transcript_14133/m.33377 type:complete len:104 (-) Transcript_14133:27-338(-)